MWSVRKLTVLFVLAVALCGSGTAIAFDETDLKKFKALNKCEGCDLSGADLKKANLQRADLSGANLREANLKGVDLRGAKLSEANLIEASGSVLFYYDVSDV